MKRDMNLVREILLWATDQPDYGFRENPCFPGYTDEQVGHHIYLMAQAGLVEAEEVTMTDSLSPVSVLLAVTWAGHDFIDVARDGSLWNKAMKKLAAAGEALTFDLLKGLLTRLAEAGLAAL